MLAGSLAFWVTPPQWYLHYITPKNKGVVFGLAILAILLVSGATERLRWWVAAPLIAVAVFVFIAFAPNR